MKKIARQKEEKSNTVKLYNTLLNSLSHELRTPIATIIGATDNLQTTHDNLTPQHRDELVIDCSTGYKPQTEANVSKKCILILYKTFFNNSCWLGNNLVI